MIRSKPIQWLEEGFEWTFSIMGSYPFEVPHRGERIMPPPTEYVLTFHPANGEFLSIKEDGRYINSMCEAVGFI